MKWHEIHQKLLAVVKGDPSIPAPPVPLILSGWTFSNDLDKRDRWESTISWADKYGVSHLLEDLLPSEMYVVERLEADPIGPMGGPMKLPWSFDAKRKLSRQERTEILGLLHSSWNDIAGRDLCQITVPVSLTGQKGRRLLVQVVADGQPSWGTWESLATGPARRRFTSLRATINQAISPNEVDHVDFVRAKEKSGREKA
jgi:hypothetical protein